MSKADELRKLSKESNIDAQIEIELEKVVGYLERSAKLGYTSVLIRTDGIDKVYQGVLSKLSKEPYKFKVDDIGQCIAHPPREARISW